MSGISLLKKYFYSFLLILFVSGMSNAYALGRVQSDPNKGEPLISLEEANQRCEVVLAIFNLDKLQGQINVIELSAIVRSLRDEGKLPPKFLTKKEARSLGWEPGRPFNEIAALRGRSLGGDHFGNYEKRLPAAKYHEADLDYLGLKRNMKRLVYENAEHMFVTIDHYESFQQVPECH
ncbi:hypothetical protein AAEX37_00852 [Oligella sp. MSHR50489EDL]